MNIESDAGGAAQGAAPIRVLLAKPTHDVHDRGVRLVARRFRDYGFEVVFTNFLLAGEIVDTALDNTRAEVEQVIRNELMTLLESRLDILVEQAIKTHLTKPRPEK